MRRWIWILLAAMLFTLPAMAEESGPTVLGVPVEMDAATVNLTSLTEVTQQQAEQLAEELKALPNVMTVDLRGVEVERKAQAALLAAFPSVHFQWKVNVAGRSVDGDAAFLRIEGKDQNTVLRELREALPCLPKLSRVTMFDPPIERKKMEALMADFPGVQFDWTIHWPVCKYVNSSSYKIVNLRTDATAFSTAKGRQDPRYTAEQLMEYLQYTPDLLALDVGHNNVSDLSFLLNWPNLRRLICIDSKQRLTDLSPLAELPDLEYVELFLQNISDLTPLANHDKLVDLNLCHNNITDFTPLYTCKNLERLYISYNPGLNDEAIAELQAALPNCHIETEVFSSTEAGWRKHPHYDILIKSFNECTYYPFDETTAN